MECNLNDFSFDNYFAALLTPIELPDTDNIDKLPPIHTLGASSGITNLFSSLSNHNFMADTSYLKPIKNEEYSTELSNSNNTLEENFLEETTWLKDDKILDTYVSDANSLDSPIPNSISEEEETIASPTNVSSPTSQASVTQTPASITTPAAIVSPVSLVSPAPKKSKKSTKKKSPVSNTAPVPIKPENVQVKKVEKASSKKKSIKTKRARPVEDSSAFEGSTKKRRTNYCFDIHRIYCPHTKKEKYYCNVTLQGKLQETVDLVKGKRGKYAYTFYDQRKERKERRYWPSQSCGPVLEDTCHCKHCNLDGVTKKVSASQEIKREVVTREAPAEDNCVIFLEEVFLDM